MIKYVQTNIKYPIAEIIARIEGTVRVSFIVNKDGSLSDFQIVKGITKGLDNEALRVVKSMPKWNPGKQLDKPVRVRLNLPIVFSLEY